MTPSPAVEAKRLDPPWLFCSLNGESRLYKTSPTFPHFGSQTTPARRLPSQHAHHSIKRPNTYDTHSFLASAHVVLPLKGVFDVVGERTILVVIETVVEDGEHAFILRSC